MKIGAAFLISLATAQDYGLDGADVNAAAFDSDYNYDGKSLRDILFRPKCTVYCALFQATFGKSK